MIVKSGGNLIGWKKKNQDIRCRPTNIQSNGTPFYIHLLSIKVTKYIEKSFEYNKMSTLCNTDAISCRPILTAIHNYISNIVQPWIDNARTHQQLPSNLLLSVRRSATNKWRHGSVPSTYSESRSQIHKGENASEK